MPGQRADFWIRIAATGLDSFIIAFIGLIINFQKLPVYKAELAHLLGSVWVWLFLGLVLYHWPLTAFKGQTVGKKLFHIKVVSAKGGKLGIGRAFLREFVGKPIASTIGLSEFCSGDGCRTLLCRN